MALLDSYKTVIYYKPLECDLNSALVAFPCIRECCRRYRFTWSLWIQFRQIIWPVKVDSLARSLYDRCIFPINYYINTSLNILTCSPILTLYNTLYTIFVIRRYYFRSLHLTIVIDYSTFSFEFNIFLSWKWHAVGLFSGKEEEKKKN